MLLFQKSFPSQISKQLQQVEEKLDFIVHTLGGEFDVLPLWDSTDNVQNQPRQHPLGRADCLIKQEIVAGDVPLSQFFLKEKKNSCLFPLRSLTLSR